MPSYNNLTEVYFTVQSLRMHHDLTDCEIVVVDNFGDKGLEKYIKDSGNGVVRYEKYTEVTGVSAAKNRIFEVAKGDYVLCIDSHILMKKGVLDKTPPGDDMIQGPMMLASANKYWCEWLPVWRANMWGIWGPLVTTLPEKPFKIWAMGAGFFAVKKDSWLGFNPKFKGFGGETGYIQEKYRKAGREVWCYPNMIWMHMFCNQGRGIPYPLKTEDRIRNYVLGFVELSLDLAPVYKMFGDEKTKKIQESLCI